MAVWAASIVEIQAFRLGKAGIGFTVAYEIIDLRSDTVTRPTAKMRSAMANAAVGDDGWGDDPTVNELEEVAAALLGKEDALLVPSGTMGNVISILSHAQRGDEIILGDQSHIYVHEMGGVSALGGVVMRQLPNDTDGTLDLNELEAAIRGTGPGFPTTRAICLENTQNRCGGAVLTTEYVDAVSSIAHARGVMVHLDGARIFNAAAYLCLPVRELATSVDSVTFCLSKGLACPVGSVVCGSKEFIRRARGMRRMFGGGMRQAGILAAAGLVAFDTMVDRLTEDHSNARRLAEGLSAIPGIIIEPGTVQTNIVIFAVSTGDGYRLVQTLNDRGLRVSYVGGAQVRMVTHCWITKDDVDQAVEIVATEMRSD